MIVFLGFGLVALTSFALVKYLTHHFLPAEYGIISLFISISGILNQFIYAPIYQWILRYYPFYIEKNLSNLYYHFFNRFQKYNLIAVFLILIPNVLFLQNGYIYAVVYGLLFGQGNLLIFHYTAQRKRFRSSLIQFLEVSLRFLLSFLAITYVNQDVLSIIICFTLAAFISSVPFYLNGPSEGVLSSDILDASKEFKKFSLTYVGFGALFTITTYLDRWLLLVFSSSHEVGLFAALYQVSNAPINILFTIFTHLLTPIVFQRAGDLNSIEKIQSAFKLLRQSSFLLLGVLFSLVIFYALFAEQLILFFASPRFISVSPLLVWMGIAFLFFQLGQHWSLVPSLLKKPEKMWFPKITQTLSFTIVCVSLIQKYGLAGVVSAHVVSSFLYFVTMYWVARRLTERAS